MSLSEQQKEALGRANYEAFCETMREWLPFPADWEKQAAAVKQGWIAAAVAVRDHNF
jgi:hypothetical protein